MQFTVRINPCGKGRHRTGRTRSGKTVHYTPKKTKDAEREIALAYKAAGGKNFGGAAVEMHVLAEFPIPKSWTKSRKENAKYHTNKPDYDNILKLVGDALNGVAYNDDSQIVHGSATKVYGEGKMAITIKEMVDDTAQ